MKAIIDSECKLYKKTVTVKDCEDCFTARKMDFVCWVRGLIFGYHDKFAPRWTKTYEKADLELRKILGIVK